MKRKPTSKGVIKGALHERQHDVTNPYDHRIPDKMYWGKVVRVNPETGRWEWVEIYTDRFVKHFDELPDPNHEDVEVGDLWNDPVTLEEYRLIEIQEGFRAWVETTSPKILSDGSGTAASPKALKLSMI